MSVSRLIVAGALLCSGSLAAAAAAVQVQEVSGSVSGSALVDVGDNLSPVGDDQWVHLNPMPAGVPLTTALRLDWDQQIDQTPGGGGSERTSGSIHIDSSASHTIDQPATGPWRMTSRGSLDVAAQWTVQDGGGDVTSALGEVLGNSYVRLDFSLAEATPARLNAVLWTPASGSTWYANTRLTFLDPDTSLHIVLENWWAKPGSQGFEAERVLQPGSYELVTYALDAAHDLPCCNIAHGGSAGWEVTLEIDALPPVPEPASLGLLLAGLAVLRQRTRQPV